MEIEHHNWSEAPVWLLNETSKANLGLSTCVKSIEGDIKKIKKIKSQSFDHVFANPPYFTENSSSVPDNENKKAANIGSKKTLDTWVRLALTFSKSGGKITFINHINNLPELLYLFDRKMGGIQVTPIFPKKISLLQELSLAE